MSSAPPTPNKRKTPAKADAPNKLGGLTETELKALCYGMACATEPIKVNSQQTLETHVFFANDLLIGGLRKAGYNDEHHPEVGHQSVGRCAQEAGDNVPG